MADAFRDIVATLWNELGLSRPRFRQDDEAATLTVDGIAVTLAPIGDRGHIAVSAQAGTLSAIPAAADEQVARLLAANLVTLPSSRACVGLDDRDSPTPAVMVRAFVPCHASAKDWLVKAISDVAYLAREHGRALGSDPAPPSVHQMDDDAASSDMVVLRL